MRLALEAQPIVVATFTDTNKTRCIIHGADNKSNESDVFYVDENNEHVEVYYVYEMENKLDEKSPRESINMDDIPSTADLSERKKPT